MKNIYEELEIEIICFEMADVITSSSSNPDSENDAVLPRIPINEV